MKKLLKALYKSVPLKKEFYTLIKKIWVPEKSIYKHLHFVGVFTVHIDSIKKFKIKHYGFDLENEVFWNGVHSGWEIESTKLWLKLCEKSETILDLGANTGIYSLMAKAINPTAKIYAFEPVSRVCDKLKENIKLNNFDIIPVEKAVSNSDGTALIFEIPAEHVYSVTVNKNNFSSDTKVIETKIETITLNTFIQQEHIKKIDLLKIDVETHEPEVLEGFSEYLSAFKPAMLIEILSDEIGEKVEAQIKHLHYLYFNIDEKRGTHQVSKITKSDGFNYLLCSEGTAREIGLV